MALDKLKQAARELPRRRMALRVAVGALGAAALYAAAGYLGGPPLLRAVVAQQASEALGRKVTVDTASFRPFSLAASLGNLTIHEAYGSTPMVSVAAIEVDASISSLWRLAPVVDAVHVDGVSARIVRDAEGRFSFDDIRQHLAARPAEPDGKPARFSINNIALTGSRIVFEDRQLGETQTIEHLTVTLPFLSNLPHDVNIVTQPTLSAHLNGSPMAISGTMLPFADAREAQLQINLDGLDLTRFAPFAPRLSDAVVKGGKLDTRLVLGFRQQQDQQRMELSGTATLHDADLRKHDGQPLLKVGRLEADLAALAPAERRIHLRALTVDRLALQALRRADGTLDLASAFLPAPASPAAPADLAVSAAPNAVGAADTAKAASTPAVPPAAQAGATPAWRYAVDRLALREARISLRDEAAFSGPATLALGPLDVRAEGLSSDSDKPARLNATLGLGDGQTFEHQGQLSLRAASLTGTLKATGIKPQGFAAWWPAQLHARLGDSAVNAELHYRLGWGQSALTLALENSRVELQRLQVALPDGVRRDGRSVQSSASTAADAESERQARRAAARGDLTGDNLPLLAADKVTLEGLQFDLAARTAAIAELRLDGPQLAASRDRRGQLVEVARIWSAGPAANRPPGPPPARAPAAGDRQSATPATAAATAQAPWQLRIGAVRIEGGKLRFADHAPAGANGNRPVVHQWRGIQLQTGGLRWPLGNEAVPLRLQAEAGRRGVLRVDGTVQPAAPSAALQLDVKALELAPLQPYLADRFNAALRAGNATVQGRLAVSAPAGKPPAASFTGTARLANVRTVDRLNGEDFVRWRSLALSGIDFRMRDKAPMQVTIGDVALSDFYARVILNANGRLNLQDVVASGPQQGNGTPTATLTGANTSANTSASTSASTSANPTPGASPAEPVRQAGEAAPDGSRSAPVANRPTARDAGPAPVIRVGGIRIDKGNINFSDYFVKPNYTANLTGMKGSVSRIATGETAPADMVLEGRLDDDAPVTINGKLNPLAQPLYLDIAARAAGVELTRLTPYAAKYAGYPITKGKMTVNVAYKIENGTLNASNHLFLEQLTFGDRVDSPDATKLPVLLAVSLLKDRNGVIDINLPVSGSLSDPEFSIGGVITRVIVNLLTKAITSPFALLASAFGGGEELGHVDFAAGSAALDDGARTRLAKLATALNDRPGLRLEITGRIDPVADAAGARKAWLQEQVVEEKMRRQRQSARQQRGNADEEGEQGARVTVTPQEYPTFLEAVYKRADFSKPRNVIGLTKSLPLAQMEALLLEHAPVTEAGLRQLAEQRALAVKQTLERDGKVPSNRLFLTAPKLEGGADGGKSSTRVDFALRQ